MVIIFFMEVCMNNFSPFFKFFKGKVWPIYAGIATTAVGAILGFVFMRQRDLRILSTVGIIIAIVGIILLMSGISGKATPADFNQEIQIRSKELFVNIQINSIVKAN